MVIRREFVGVFVVESDNHEDEKEAEIFGRVVEKRLGTRSKVYVIKTSHNRLTINKLFSKYSKEDLN